MFDLLTSLLARAKSLFFDNSVSGLTATNVQDAIDELAKSGGSQPYTSLTDPALNSITQNMVDTKGGVVITLTGAGNNQTLPAPTDTSIAHEFTVINNDTSTNNINIIGASTVAIDPGRKVKWTYDGSAWIASDAEGIIYDDGTNIKAQTSTRNFDAQTGFLKGDSLKINDSDDSNTLNTVWNENDSSDRTLNLAVGSGDRTLTLNENFTIGDGTNITITAEDNDASVVLDNANLEIENTNATQRNMKLVHGTDADSTLTIEGANSVVNQDVSSDASPTFTALNIGSNTQISESTGDTTIENKSATKNIFLKLGDALGATYAQVKDSAGTVLGYCSSLGTWLLGKVATEGVIEVRDASDVVQEKLNAVSPNYHKGLYELIGTGSAGAIDYSLADEGYIDLDSSKTGWGFVQVGDDEERAFFSFSSAAVVTLMLNSTNVVNSDTDTKFCIFDNGTSVRIKNRLGSTKVISVRINYK